jgi:hypothetical protein
LGIGHVLQDSSGGLRILFNAIATPLLFMIFTGYQSIQSGLLKSTCAFYNPRFFILASRAHRLQLSYPLSSSKISILFDKPKKVCLTSETVNIDLPATRGKRQRWAASRDAMKEPTAIS